MSHVGIDVREGVAIVTMSRPPVNALDPELVTGLEHALDRIDADEAVRVILVTSQGTKAFCAGADIDVMAKDRGAMFALVERIRRVLDRIESHELPSIAALGAPATGGGLELALACDLRVAGRSVRLGVPEIKLGLIPGAGGTQRLAELAGRATATRLILEGALITGDEAATLGIVQHSVADDEVGDFARRLASTIAAYPTAAVRGAKRCIALARSDAGFAAELSVTEELFASEATNQALAEFLGRRRPRSR